MVSGVANKNGMFSYGFRTVKSDLALLKILICLENKKLVYEVIF